MKSARQLIEKWDGHLQTPACDASGREFFSSKMRRAVQAFALQRAAEAKAPELGSERQLRAAEAEALERQRLSAEAEANFHAETPSALRRMGLEEQEIAALGDLQQSPAVRAVEAWWAGKKLFLTLGGATDGGKTIAAASVLLHCRDFVRTESLEGWHWRPGKGRFLKATALARLGYFGEEVQAMLEKLHVVPLLVLDDMGTEMASEGFRSTFVELVDARARAGLRTVLTTNLPGDKFRARYDGRAMRRLLDFGEFVAVQKRGNQK